MEPTAAIVIMTVAVALATWSIVSSIRKMRRRREHDRLLMGLISRLITLIRENGEVRCEPVLEFMHEHEDVPGFKELAVVVALLHDNFEEDSDEDDVQPQHSVV